VQEDLWCNPCVGRRRQRRDRKVRLYQELTVHRRWKDVIDAESIRVHSDGDTTAHCACRVQVKDVCVCTSTSVRTCVAESNIIEHNVPFHCWNCWAAFLTNERS